MTDFCREMYEDTKYVSWLQCMFLAKKTFIFSPSSQKVPEVIILSELQDAMQSIFMCIWLFASQFES